MPLLFWFAPKSLGILIKFKSRKKQSGVQKRKTPEVEIGKNSKEFNDILIFNVKLIYPSKAVGRYLHNAEYICGRNK
jgi:hypothetical protein